jgi:uncharacterized membrane protein
MMSRTTGTLLIVLSVALNFAFVASWGLHRLPSTCGRHAAKGAASHPGAACPFHERLQATPEQRQEIESRLESFRESSVPICMRVNKHRIELIDLLAAPEPDHAAIQAKQKQILDGQSQMQERVIAHLLAMRTALSPTQRRILFDTIRERSDCAGHGHMMMGLSGNAPCQP